jgi:CubicO group peptidase (beta-lactamase class C family)
LKEPDNNNIIKEIDLELFSAYQTSSNFPSTKNDIVLGTYSFEDKEKITEDTPFDLASLTKALFTAPAFYELIFSKEIDKNSDISSFFPVKKVDITLLELLSHTSGYPAWIPFYEKIDGNLSIDQRKEAVEKMILETQPGKKTHLYSDFNYILLGFILEKIYHKDLGKVLEEFILRNNLPTLTFGTEKKAPLTAFSSLRKTFPAGEVEDENCYFLGGKTGHAGLFASAETVKNFMTKLINIEWFQTVGKDLDFPGFDRPQGEDSNYGKNATSKMIGHLGFTGTAFLSDPEENKTAVILTNSTHPTPEKTLRKERMRKVRQMYFG